MMKRTSYVQRLMAFVITLQVGLFLQQCQSQDPSVRSMDTVAEQPMASDSGDFWENAELVWSDEFNGTALDSTKWSLEQGGQGWGNNELQYYTNGDNVIVADGKLSITAKKEEYGGNAYTSARLNSIPQFTYGKMEVRAKIPQYKGKGLWPAIWLLGNDIETLGWPACGEIDMMEYVSYSPNEVHATIHSTDNNHTKGTQITSGPVLLEDIEEEFHVYGLLWTEEYLRFYIDQPENTLLFVPRPDNPTNDNWPFTKPYYFLLNMAVGGNWGGLEGVEASAFPATLEIDYVRVHQVKP